MKHDIYCEREVSINTCKCGSRAYSRDPLTHKELVQECTTFTEWFNASTNISALNWGQLTTKIIKVNHPA